MSALGDSENDVFSERSAEKPDPKDWDLFSKLSFAERGFDPHCGAGQLAALRAHRALIHYRSRSNPFGFSAKTKEHPEG